MGGNYLWLAMATDPDTAKIELAAIAVSSISVVGAALSFPRRHEILQIATTNLRRALMLSQILTCLAVVMFVGAVVLGVAGGPQADVIYSALTGGAFGAIALLVGRHSKSAQNLAFKASEEAYHRDQHAVRYELVSSLVEGIENGASRDAARIELARQLIDSVAPVETPTVHLQGARKRLVAPARKIENPALEAQPEPGDDATAEEGEPTAEPDDGPS